MMRYLILSLLLSISIPVDAQVPSDYYSTVDTTDATTLRKTLHEVIDDHQRIPYSSRSLDTWAVLERADQDPNNQDNILDLYRNTSMPKQGGRNDSYNQEHCWPTSYGFPRYRVGNYPFTDCHAIFLCNSRYNSSRGNKPYMDCEGECQEKQTSRNNCAGASVGVYPGYSNWTLGVHAAGAWETWSGRRGDVARALFYLDVRYEGGTHLITGASDPDLILTDDRTLIMNSDTDENESVAYMGMLSVLLEWHQQDPVDDLERRRNDVVFLFQANRNPFIDHPEWVRSVFDDDCR